MFAERFDALMNIAEVSNSMLGRDIKMALRILADCVRGQDPLQKDTIT